jgi:hypothetical protein
MISLIQQQEGSYIKDHVHVGAGAVLGGAQQVAEQVVPAAHRLLVLGLQVVEKRREVQVQDAAVVEQAPVIEVHDLSRADHRPLLLNYHTCFGHIKVLEGKRGRYSPVLTPCSVTQPTHEWSENFFSTLE